MTQKFFYRLICFSYEKIVIFYMLSTCEKWRDLSSFFFYLAKQKIFFEKKMLCIKVATFVSILLQRMILPWSVKFAYLRTNDIL